MPDDVSRPMGPETMWFDMETNRFDQARGYFRRKRLSDMIRGRIIMRAYADCPDALDSPLISGIVSELFPDAIKARLRRLARAGNRYCAAGFAARPYRVRMETMRRLYQESAP